MKTAEKFARIAQGSTMFVAIYKVDGMAQKVVTITRPLRPVLFRKGKTSCIKSFKSRATVTRST